MRTRVPGVMDNFRYSNSVIARTATDFYFHGIPAGVVSRVSDVAKPALFHDLDFKIPVLNCEPISELPAAVTGNLGPPVLNDSPERKKNRGRGSPRNRRSRQSHESTIAGPM